jgi:hypothetical protein
MLKHRMTVAGPDASVYVAINRIRERSALPDLPAGHLVKMKCAQPSGEREEWSWLLKTSVIGI